MIVEININNEDYEKIKEYAKIDGRDVDDFMFTAIQEYCHIIWMREMEVERAILKESLRMKKYETVRAILQKRVDDLHRVINE